MNRKKSIFAVLFFYFNQSYCHENGPIKFSKGYFPDYISSYLLKHHTQKIDTLGLKSCSFVSFKVSSNGKIDSIACNVTTPRVLADLFIEAVASSEGMWVVNDTSQKKTPIAQSFILPIIYFFEGRNGGPEDRTQTSVLKMLDFTGKPKIESIPWLPNNLTGINCVLFGPIFFRSPIY